MTRFVRALFVHAWLLLVLVPNGAFAVPIPSAAGPVAAAPAEPDTAPVPDHFTACENGAAAGFPCSRVDLEERLTTASMGGGSGNDLWGWTDPVTGREYALMGLTNSTAFVDITIPDDAELVGSLARHAGTSTSIWRDIKTYGNYAFIVSEAVDHGMQVFDLTRLRSYAGTPIAFTENAHYGNFGRTHNIVIDEASGFAYAVGSRQGTQSCNGGLHMIDIRNPLIPTFAGCFGDDGYTHDAQCTVYQGPDIQHQGKQICFAENEDTLTIVDVTDKSNPVQLSRTGYAGVGYTHQGWLTEDQRHILVDDETDEINSGHNTRTYVFDLADLDAPLLHMTYTGTTSSSDHNLYIKGNFAFQANYRSGLRILDISRIAERDISEYAYFDTQPTSNASGTSGAWSVYPYFASGTVIVSDVSAGLFVLRPDLCTPPVMPTGLGAVGGGANRIDLAWDAQPDGISIDVLRSIDNCAGAQTAVADGLTGAAYSDTTVSGGIDYGYRIRARSADGLCLSQASECVVAQTSGACTAPPVFVGIVSASSPGTAGCAIELGWSTAAARCTGPIAYRVERSTGPTFDEASATVVAAAATGNGFVDTGVLGGTSYAYRVRAIDSGNGAADSNQTVIVARADGPVGDGDFATGAELGDPVLGDVASRHVAWETVSTVAHTGQRSYHSTYENSICLALTSAPLTITSGQSSMLSFWTRYAMEAGWDGGVVQVSSNDGANWSTMAPVGGGYPSSFNGTSNDACGLPNNSGAFTGSALTWTPYTIDLSALSGTVRFRFLFSTDGAATDQGWWIDDVRMTHVQVPGMCTSSLELIFANGFE